MAIRYVVLDFDGTCTQVDQIWQGFLAAYLNALRAANPAHASAGDPVLGDAAWVDALAQVRAAAPRAGWTLENAPGTAPACADPYIQTGEAAALLQRAHPALVLPKDAFAHAYADHPAPWRAEAADVLAALHARGLRVGFVSNSDTAKVRGRVDALLAGAPPALRAAIAVIGNARKYLVGELPLEGAPHAARFAALAPTHAAASAAVGRPVYLRRARYFQALVALWRALGAADDEFPIAEALVCGDVWELDLAMPAALGAHVHLIRRAAPYDTYAYEHAQVGPAHQSDDLHAVLDRVGAAR